MSGPDDIYDGTVADVRAMTDAPTPRDVLRPIVAKWFDEGYEAGKLDADVLTDLVVAALTRREPLDVERLARSFVMVIDRRPMRVEVRYFYGDDIPVEVQREAFLRDLAAEYARLEAADKP